MRALSHILFLIFFTVSCIKETPDECPYQYNIQLYVIDKNYFNASAIGVEISEDLPFKQYIKNIFYTLYDPKTGRNVIEPQYLDISQTEKEVSLIFDFIPDGEYVLTVWGNVNNESKNYLQNPGLLHKDKKEDTDIYVATGVLNIVSGLAQEMRLGMERTKGKLEIKFENLPVTISNINQSTSSIYANVDNKLIYTNETVVEKVFQNNDIALLSLMTFLAPTVEGKRSQLMLLLNDINNQIILTIPAIEIFIKRNELTVLEINYNEVSNSLEIWLFLINEWILVNELDININ